MVLESNTLDVLFVKDGQQGEDGKILYTWIKYAKDANGTGITDDPNGAIYIGISYNNESSTESNDPTQYAWTKIQGADGKKGEDAYTIFLENENISFATDKNRNPLSEQAYTSGITIMKGAKPVTDFTIGDIAKTQGIAVAKTDTAIAISVVNGNSLPNDSGEIEIPITVGGTVFKKILTWTCAKKGDQGEKGERGLQGIQGPQGIQGVAGKDGTSVTITNKSITYQLSTSGTTIPTGTWQTSPQTIPEGQYQWTKTSVTYSDGNKTESYSISYHGKNGSDGTSVKTTSTSVKYQVGDSGTTKPTGTWQSNVPTVAQGKYLWTQTIVNYSDGNSTESYSVSYRGIDGSNGVNGMNVATIYLYQRATSTPSKPSNTLTYTFSTTKITGTLNNGWSTAIPTGTDAVYVTVASVSSKNDTATIATSAWSAPVVLAQNGKTGSDGKAGLNVATIYLYQRNTSKPSKPSASVTYTFSTGVASGLNNGWSQKIPDGTNPLYVTLATASSNTATDTILSSEWSDVVVMAQNGEDGISPKVSLSKSGNTTTISIIDATGTHTQTVKDGTNGTPGAAGKDGKTSYFHVKYSNDGGKTFTSNSGEDTGIYMGSYTDYTETDSTDVKKYNWVKVKGDKGDTGQKGDNAKNLSITPSSQYFKSTDGGKTFAPNTITIRPTIQGEISFGKWQYSIDGGVSFADVVGGQKGLTISNNVLTVSKDSSLYSDAVTMITFRAVASDSSFYDTCSIAKIYDVNDIGDGRNLLWNSNFAKTDEAINTVTYTTWGLILRGSTYTATIDTSVKHNNFNTLKVIGTKAGENGGQDLIYRIKGLNLDEVKFTETDVKYTLSFYAKASIACNFSARYAYDSYAKDTNVALSTDWKRYEIQMHPTTTSYQTALIFKMDAASTVWFSEFKLEKGSSATGYSTAPEDVQTAILSTKSEISDVSLKVDKNKQAIEQRVEKTTYQQDLNLVKGDINKANEGLNKWRYEIYPKSLFVSEYQGKSTMDVFAKNTNLTPSQSVLINDTDLSIAWNYAENYIGYALTFAKFSAAKSVAITFAHDDGAHIYLNGKLIGGSDAYNNKGESLTLGFVKGWNCIEVVVNEGGSTEGFTLDTTISALSECQLMNCYYGTPVARQSHITNQLVQNTTDIDGVSGSVQKVMSTVGGSGKIDEFVNNYSTWKKKVDDIETRVGETYTTKSDFDGLEIGGRNLVRLGGLSGNGATSFSYDKTTDTYTIVSPVVSTVLGVGATVKYDDSHKVLIPYGKTYILSFEVKVPQALSINIDINNYAVSGSSWAGNDNDAGSTRGQSSYSIPANTWTKVWVRWANTNTKNTNKVDLYDKSSIGLVTKDCTSAVTWQIRHVKGELGNKPTDWTPAPEDVNGKIVNVETIANQTAKKFEWIVKGGDKSSNMVLTDDFLNIVANNINLTGKVTFNSFDSAAQKKINDIDTKAGNASTAASTAQASANNAKAAADKAQSTADSANSVAKNAQSSVDNLEIGGRNLILGTSNGDPAHWYVYGWSNINNLSSSTKADHCYLLKNGNGWCNMVYDCTSHIGETVTFQADVLLDPEHNISDDAGLFYMFDKRPFGTNKGDRYILKSCKIMAADTWVHMEHTFTIDKDNPFIGFYFRGCTSDTSTNSCWIYIKDVKLEKGSKATDYTPAPEDVSQDATNKASQALTDAKNYSSNAVNWVTNNGSSTTSLNSMVKKWTDGAVSDTAQINGGWIKANTITASKIAIGDFTNYCQLDKDTASSYGFTATDDTKGVWYTASPIDRDKDISQWFTCEGGQKLYVEYDLSTTVKGKLKASDTDISYLTSGIMIFVTNGTKEIISYTRSKGVTATSDGAITHISVVETLPADARFFRVVLQTNGQGNTFSGTLKIRNPQVRKATTGKLIVDGSITADKIAANAITADKIATDAIKSHNYISSGGTQGSFLNLKDGSFTAPNLSWDLNGNLIAKNANLSGEITATDGSIGKFKITDQWLITGSGSTCAGLGGSGQAFWAGAENSTVAPFRVEYDGKLYANGATISGDITATTGKIGDLTLKDGILTGTGSYSEPYTEDDDGTVTSTITTNYITKLFGKGLTIDSTVKYSDEDDVYSYKVSVLPDEISFTDGEEIGMLGAGGLQILQVNDNSDSYSSEANEVSLSSGASNFYYTTPVNQTTDKYLHVCFSADGASFMASQGDKFNSFDIGYSSAKYSGNFAANKFVYTGNSLNYVECLEANDTTNIYFHSNGYYSFRVNNEGNWSNETQSVYITERGISVPGQIGLYSQEMSNYVARYYIAGSTKSTAIGNNSYQTRIYGSSVWANKAVSTSDVRLKQDFQSLDKFEDLYMQLQPVSFKYIDGYDKSEDRYFGLKAQPTEKLFEDMGENPDDYAMFNKFGIDHEDIKERIGYDVDFDEEHGLDYTNLITLNTHMVQKTRRELAELQKENAELKDMLKTIVKKINM